MLDVRPDQLGVLLLLGVDQAEANRLCGQIARMRWLTGRQNVRDQVAHGGVAKFTSPLVNLVELPPAIRGDFVAAHRIIAVGLVGRQLGPTFVVELEKLGDTPM